MGLPGINLHGKNELPSVNGDSQFPNGHQQWAARLVASQHDGLSSLIDGFDNDL